MELIIPNKLSLAYFDLVRPRKGQIPGYKTEKLLYAIHTVLKGMAHSDQCEDGVPWVHLQSQILKAVLGNHYKKYFRWLVKRCILRENNKYLVGHFSKSYAFPDRYLTGTQIVELPQAKWTPKFIDYKQYYIKGEGGDIIESNSGYKEINKYGNSTFYDPKVLSPFVVTDLEQWFNWLLTVEVGGAKKAIKSILTDPTPRFKYRKLKNYDEHGVAKIYRSKKKVKPKTSYARANMQIELLKINDFKQLHRDIKIARLYSSLVSLNKKVRPYLSYDGQQLGYIDVKNCQPFLILAFFNPEFWISQLPHLASIYHQVFPNGSLETSLLTIDKIGYSQFLFPNSEQGRERYRRVLNAVNLVQASEDAQSYQQSVQNGTFYQDMIEAIFSGKTIKDVKEYMFTILFTSNRFLGQRKAWSKRKFKELYPSVYQLLAAIKYGNGCSSNLPLLLQRLESHIMIDVASARISETQPGIPIFPIHDGMATLASEIDVIKEQLTDSFRSSINLVPGFHEEIWQPGKTKPAKCIQLPEAILQANGEGQLSGKVIPINNFSNKKTNRS